MKDWLPLGSVPELKTIYSHASATSGELSALIEMKPGTLDDRTGALKVSELQYARREARKLARAAGGAAYYTGLMKRVLLPSLILATGVGLVLWRQEVVKWGHGFSNKIPKVEGVTGQDYEEMNAAAEAPLSTTGPKIKMVLVNSKSRPPELQVGTNLPNGVLLDFYLLGKPGKVLSKTWVDIRLSFTVSNREGKTPPLHLRDGSALPPGEYTVYLAEDDEQSPEIRTFLGSLPEVPGIIEKPRVITAGRKLFATSEVFVGERSSELNSQLSALKESVRKDALGEFQDLRRGFDYIEALFTATINAGNEVFGKSINASVVKHWNAFHQQWNPDHPVAKMKGVYFTEDLKSILGLRKDVQDFHESINQVVTQVAGKPTLQTTVQPQLHEKARDIRAKISALHTWFKATEAELANTEYMPGSL